MTSKETHTNKTLLRVLLAATMLLLLCGVLSGAAAADPAPTSGKCGDNITWNFVDGTLTISGTGAMDDYPYYEAPWNSYRESITSVVIGDGITSIGMSAFYDCNALTSVTIPESITSIGEISFSYCESLPSVTIPESITSIGDSAFDNCQSLETVTFAEGSKLETIGNFAFCYCRSLSSITIPKNVTIIGESVFEGCSSLENISDILVNITSIGKKAFADTRPASISIPAGVVSIGDGAFSSCTELTSITVDAENPGYKAENDVLFSKDGRTLHTYPAGKDASAYRIPDVVTGIAFSAFYNNFSLTSVTIPKNVTIIGESAFENCQNLEIITFAEGSKVDTIGAYAFQKCSSLASMRIPAGVTSIGECAFDECTGLSVIYIEGDASLITGNYPESASIAVTNGGIVRSIPAKPTLATPEKRGYTFAGWYKNPDWSGSPVTTYEEGGKYYAKWAPVKKRTGSTQEETSIWLKETPTPEPTVTPTVTPTATPTQMAEPMVKPTTQSTGKSPVPFMGILAGLGAAMLTVRMRQK